MWLVPKVKLVVSIFLTALLSSVFLMVQVCLLESNCYRGLSEMAGAHRRALYRITGCQFLYIDDLAGTYADSNPSKDNNTIWRTREPYIQQSMEYMYMSNRSFNSTPLPFSNLSRTPSQRISNVSSHTLPPSSHHYRVVSKESYAMFRYFNTQLSQHQCKLLNCMDRLSNFDKAWFDYCTQKQTKGKGKRSDEVKTLSGDCRFMRGEGRAPVALVSLPGSGNTWVRGLLEKATGICTGSVYCDVQLRLAGFNGEEIRSGSVLAVKTHKSTFSWTNATLPTFDRKGVPSYGAVILLLRNPYSALVAEWNRKKSSTSRDTSERKKTSVHTRTVAPENFGTNREWNSFVKTKMLKWKAYIENVILKSPPEVPKLVVRYEDFQKDRVGEVCRVLDFLHFPYSRESVRQRLEEDFSTFHRNRHTDFEAFTHSQTQLIDTSLRHILDTLSARNSGETYGIEEYLRNSVHH